MYGAEAFVNLVNINSRLSIPVHAILYVYSGCVIGEDNTHKLISLFSSYVIVKFHQSMVEVRIE